MITRVTTRSHEAWEEIRQLIQGATKSIELEQYIFTADEAGTPIIKDLIDASRRGVRIRMVVDMIGSFSMYMSNMPKILASHGIEIRFFNPRRLWQVLNLFSFSANFFRDHRKVLIVDGVRAWVGGVGIRHEFKEWRDTSMTVEGVIVSEVRRAFELVWKRLDINSFGYRRFKKILPESTDMGVIINAPRIRQRQIYKALRRAMDKAQTRIILATPYFIPDESFWRAMRRAKRRGVYVALIVPKVTDQKMVDYARRHYIHRLLKRGIDVFLYHQHFFHAKYALIDSWATMGSSNYDSLSFRFNHELNIEGADPVFVAHIDEQAREDMIASEKADPKTWNNRSWSESLKEWLLWPFHAFL